MADDIETKQDVDLEDNNDDERDDQVDGAPAKDEGDAKGEKPKRTPEEQLKYLEGRTQRLRTKLGLTAPKAPKAEKTEGLDRVDRAVLRAEKITSAKEVELVEEWKKETGKDVEKILESKHFQAELKDLRDLAAAKDAAPEGSKRSGQSPRDEVDYWIAKGELPKDNPELARKVVNAKMQQIKSKNQFTDDPIQ
jgi:hypothetical protein